VLVGCWQ